jgi:hypothetical protein
LALRLVHNPSATSDDVANSPLKEIAMTIAHIFGTSREAADFEQGFYGEAFEKFDRLGPKMVRHLFETHKLAGEIEHNAAEIWLGRKDRLETRRATILSYVALAISALSLVVSTFNLVVAVNK